MKPKEQKDAGPQCTGVAVTVGLILSQGNLAPLGMDLVLLMSVSEAALWCGCMDDEDDDLGCFWADLVRGLSFWSID